MKFPVTNRSCKVQFVADIDCDESAKDSVKLGLAVKWAIKHRASLSRADLRGADLRGAYLCLTNLRDARNIPDEARLLTQIVPETGMFEAWKKCKKDAIVHLRIPASAARSNATSRKCRAERAKVLAIFSATGKRLSTAKSERGGVYRVGEYTACHKWCENRWEECAGGIHFFLTRAEAERW